MLNSDENRKKVIDSFPKLIGDKDFKIVKAPSPDYNCFAWAANHESVFWQPLPIDKRPLVTFDGVSYDWPFGAADDCKLSTMISIFSTLGYVECVDGSLEAGFRKIALYGTEDEVTHAARQLISGKDRGKWYEIARFPNYFERKLKCTSATYTLRDDGKITMLNAGNYITDPQKISSVNGVAWIPDKKSPAKLKVQFFWPFSGDYWIMYLDKDYRYVLVGDSAHKYLWILAREKQMDEPTYKMLLQKAIDNGYDVKSIIRVEQDCN